MDLQQSLKAVKLYLKLVAVRMVSLQFILKIDFQQMIIDGYGKYQLIPKTKNISLISMFKLQFTRNQGI